MRPVSSKKTKKFEALMIHSTVKGARRIRVVKAVLRVVEVNNIIVEEDVIGAINIGWVKVSLLRWRIRGIEFY